MLRRILIVLAAAALVGAAPVAAAQPPSARTLPAFKSDAQLRSFLRSRLARTERREAALPVAAPAPSTTIEEIVTTGARAEPSITNNQETGVDEGDIVKARGDLLIVLRRGRLFTLSLAGGRMTPVDHLAASPPRVNARSDWYDEMLVSGGRVIVIGYSYSRGGTEINRFRLDAAGHLAYEDSYHLRSDDYYSSRNYASRLIGHRLVFYSPLYLGDRNDPFSGFPGLQHWRGPASKDAFKPIITSRRVFIPPSVRDDPEAQLEALHTVTTCDLDAPELSCSATAVLGAESRTFYVSGQAVYLWISSAGRLGDRGPSILVRMPLDGGAPSAVQTRGAPTDQFAFREDPAQRTLNVLVRSDARGDAMWRPEFSEGAVALLRLPLGAFGDGSAEASRGRYRLLPRPGPGYDFHARFVGDHLLYGSGGGWGGKQDRPGKLVVAPLRGGPVQVLPLGHGVDRIEAMDGDALVAGSGEQDLTLTAIRLSGPRPAIGDRYVLRGASEGETRSHGFFFQPAVGGGGVLALPIARPGRPTYRQLTEDSAAVIFVRWADARFLPLGELAARQEGLRDDDCVASCADWYGNARPIFLRGRTFALMGYELVEGALAPRTIKETARIDFTPSSRSAPRR